MKILQITMFILGAFIAVNCQKSSDDIKRDEEIDIIQDNTFEEREIIQDNTFEKGFSLTPLDPKIATQGGGVYKTFIDTLDFGRDGSAPIWYLGQWYGKFCLSGAELSTASDGSVYYTDEGGCKKVALYPDNSLFLERNASKDYDYENPGVILKGWPHFLIHQQFKENSPNVGKAKQLLFSMELKLEKVEYKMAPDGIFDPSIHNAIAALYFVIVNKNKNSPDYNQWFWFSTGGYNYRQTKMPDREFIFTVGTSTSFLYAIPPILIWGDIDFRDKKWHKGKVDLKPFILRALQLLKEKGVFMKTTPDDLEISYMNFGWELSWTDLDVALRVKNISLIKIY